MTGIIITHEIGSSEGDCNISFSGLNYKRWSIFVDVEPPVDASKIRHVKYILPQCYPHRTIKVKNTIRRFQYRTCGYQSNTVECLIDFSKGSETKSITVSHFVDFNKNTGKTEVPIDL